MNDSAIRILRTANAVRDLLLEKNEAYGDSALEPSNIFAKGSAVENICCRIDDKLMRIKNKGINDSTEDTIQDLIGYLILLKIAVEDERTRTIFFTWQFGINICRKLVPHIRHRNFICIKILV